MNPITLMPTFDSAPIDSEPETHESSDGCTIDGPPSESCGCQSCRFEFGPAIGAES